MKTTVIRCDGCGTERREVNHWYYVGGDSSGFLIWKWEDRPEMEKFRHYCGTECLTKALAQWAE